MDIPKELLSEEFLSQFKTEEDVSNFPDFVIVSPKNFHQIVFLYTDVFSLS